MMFDGKLFGEEMVGIVKGYVDRATAPLIAENKALADRIAELEARAQQAGEKGQDGKDGRDGADADPELIAKMVADAVASIPAPANGRDGVDGKDGVGINGKDGRDGADGKDGAGIADLVIDRDGNLIASFTDGRLKTLGQIIGKDGRDGIDGKDGIPFGVDDLNMSLMEDGRTIRLAFAKGETEYAFQIGVPTMIYRGVYREGSAYEQGDTVTWGGSLWHADKATSGKPDSGDWTLAAKRGRDGRDKA